VYLEHGFRRLQKHIYKIWKDADDKENAIFPHEFMYKMLLSGVLEEYYEIDLKDSWMYAAAEKKTYLCSRLKIVLWVIYLLHMLQRFKASTMKSELNIWCTLSDWYPKNSSSNGIGFSNWWWYCR
jgi:deoxyhypusine synthase